MWNNQRSTSVMFHIWHLIAVVHRVFLIMCVFGVGASGESQTSTRALLWHQLWRLGHEWQSWETHLPVGRVPAREGKSLHMQPVKSYIPAIKQTLEIIMHHFFRLPQNIIDLYMLHTYWSGQWGQKYFFEINDDLYLARTHSIDWKWQ